MGQSGQLRTDNRKITMMRFLHRDQFIHMRAKKVLSRCKTYIMIGPVVIHTMLIVLSNIVYLSRAPKISTVLVMWQDI